MIVVSHPTGNSNVRSALDAFAQRNLLKRFYTTIAWRMDSPLGRFLPFQVRKELERRTYSSVPYELIGSRWIREVSRQVALKLKWHSLCVGEEAIFSIDNVYSDLDQHVAKQLKRLKDVDLVYAYEDGAVETFRSAQALGIRRVYDLPIGYWRPSRALAEREAIEAPEWASSLAALNDSEGKHLRKDQELDLANQIVVASEFTKNSLKSYPNLQGKQIVVIPYGAPHPTTVARSMTNPNEPLRVLYVGALSQRKGLSYLAEAMKMVRGKANLTLIGRPPLPVPEPIKNVCNLYRWIPSLAHGDLLDEMARHDVLLFPSLFEGFGLVITEAISQGLPVITTANTGGPEVLREGVDGFIVPIRSAEAIATKLLLLANDRGLLYQMSNSALERAKEMSWGTYQQRLVSAVIGTTLPYS